MANGVLDICTTGTIGDILSGQSCDQGGVYKIFYGMYSDVNWGTSTFNTTTKELTAVTMNASKVLYEISFDIENARYDATLQNSAFYETSVVVPIFGKGVSNWGTINNIKGLCGDLFMIVFGNDCGTRLIGVTRNTADDGFQQTFEPLKLSDHLDTSGIPTEKAREEVTFMCKSRHAPLYTTLTISDVTALL